MTKNIVKEKPEKDSNKAALHYMKTLVEVAREGFLILDPKLRVISGNPIFYKTFKVKAKDTEKELIFRLGNGQWNIPELKRMLLKILPEKKIIKDFEVTHTFESIGQKTILLNASQLDSVQMIILAMEDISARKELEKKLAEHTKELEVSVASRTTELANRVRELESLNKTMVGRELKMVELKKELANARKGS